MNDNWTFFEREYFRLKIDELREYVITIESSLNTEFDAFENWVEEQISQMNADEEELFFDNHSDTAWSLKDTFPRMTRNAVFASSYFHLEYELTALCKQLRSKDGIKLKIQDLNHSGIHAAKVYMKKVCGIDFPDQTEEWRRITIYNKIRNFVAHNNGKLDLSDNAKKIREYQENCSNISISGMNEIMLTKAFCLETLDTIGSFYNTLLDAIDSRND